MYGWLPVYIECGRKSERKRKLTGLMTKVEERRWAETKKE